MCEEIPPIAQLDRASAFNELEPSGWKIEKIVKKGDYLYAVVRNHPKRIKHDYVLHHRVVMENHLKRLLYDEEVVHHIDGNKKNNSIDNLELTTSSEHTRFHGLQNGKMWAVFKCPICEVVFERERRLTFLRKQHSIKSTCCSPSCRGILSRKVQLNQVTPEVERAISENILLEYRKFSRDNAEETATTGSVETIRTSPEMVKT